MDCHQTLTPTAVAPRSLRFRALTKVTRCPDLCCDAAIRVVGIDDWAWQKGQQFFGTILVDLERRRVVDVLAVRTADAVAAWLRAHPTIRIISRDRHGPYGNGGSVHDLMSPIRGCSTK